MALEVGAVSPRLEGIGASAGSANEQPRSGQALVKATLEQPIQTAELSIGVELFGYHPHYRPRRDRDRDGIPDHRDRDRDNDGIPNRWDPNPNRPNYPYYPVPPRRLDRPCYWGERPDFYNRFGQPRCY